MEALWRGQLADGLSRLGISLAEAQVDLLVRYLALLEKWNRVFNLTAVRDSGEMVERHLMDSLSVLPHIKGSRLLDVGSGAGLPGIPLAVACPDLYVELIDSISKKARLRHGHLAGVRVGRRVLALGEPPPRTRGDHAGHEGSLAGSRTG